MIRALVAYLLAILTAYVLAVVLATQAVVQSLVEMGVTVAFGLRLSMTLQDLAGMAGVLMPLIAAAYLVAFLVATLLTRWLGQFRPTVFILAGAVALITLHLTLKYALGITPVAAARTTGGLLAQGVAGGIGAYVFSLLVTRLDGSVD